MSAFLDPSLPVHKPSSSHTISYCKINDINIETLFAGINSYPMLTVLQLLMIWFCTKIIIFIDLLISWLSCSTPWVTPTLRQLKTKGPQLEHLYRKTGHTIHKELYNNHILHYKDCIAKAKSTYYSGAINSYKLNSKVLFSMLKNITKPADSLPQHTYFNDFCITPNAFFSTKIQTIHQQLIQNSHLVSSFSVSIQSSYCCRNFRFNQKIQILHMSTRPTSDCFC